MVDGDLVDADEKVFLDHFNRVRLIESQAHGRQTAETVIGAGRQDRTKNNRKST